ncbi:uncharacterized protein BDZ99DRAFT_524042 [Mytilinidion resinicola]|uniref:Uncharacterized protein n=1 Tax=Mytilinidion resinicola TaxID=574789 RepID=A0A6A6YD80_9PEZI|nr:uncharacterized protein BDZ99DRAFT_524042 [Mytilinidion resinicola]KAF2805797.1 hypothetical protein BDZ99DRAFT_524042 [Mytilinidion resinicola]
MELDPLKFDGDRIGTRSRRGTNPAQFSVFGLSCRLTKWIAVFTSKARSIEGAAASGFASGSGLYGILKGACTSFIAVSQELDRAPLRYLGHGFLRRRLGQPAGVGGPVAEAAQHDASRPSGSGVECVRPNYSGNEEAATGTGGPQHGGGRYRQMPAWRSRGVVDVWETPTLRAMCAPSPLHVPPQFTRLAVPTPRPSSTPPAIAAHAVQTSNLNIAAPAAASTRAPVP